MAIPDQTTDTDELERAAEQIEAPLASLVGDYEEADAGNAPRVTGIFLLPNLLTSGALFCGFYSIIAGMQGDFYAGAVAILVAMIFDGLDGRVARLTRTSSAFGAQYDSLSDMVSFGLAPALLTSVVTLTCSSPRASSSSNSTLLMCPLIRFPRSSGVNEQNRLSAGIEAPGVDLSK